MQLGADDVKRRSALEAIESLIPKEVCSLTLTYISDSFGGLACCFTDAVVCGVFFKSTLILQSYEELYPLIYNQQLQQQ